MQDPPVVEIVLPTHRGEIGAPQLGQVHPGRIGPAVGRSEGVHLDRLHLRDGPGHVIAAGQRPQQHQHPVGGRRPRVEALRYGTPIARSADDVFATPPAIRAGQAHVDHPPLVQVIGRTHQRPRRQLHHHRPGADIEHQPGVRGVRVRSEHQLLRRALQYAEHLVGHHPRIQIALPGGHDRHRRIEKPVRRYRPVQISVVIAPPDRLHGRIATLEHVGRRISQDSHLQTRTSTEPYRVRSDRPGTPSRGAPRTPPTASPKGRQNCLRLGLPDQLPRLWTGRRISRPVY